MDGKRFDALSRFLAARQTRRRAVVSGGAAVLGLAGMRSAQAQADDETGLGDDGICRMQFETTVRFGPTLDTQNAPTISGVLQLEIGENGGIGEGKGVLELEGGVQFPVVGQAPGQSIALRISLGNRTIVAIGVGDGVTQFCAGTFSGRSIGPAEGDLGDWIATADDTGNVPAGSDTSTATAAAPSSTAPSSGSGSGSQSGGGEPTSTPCALTQADCSDLLLDTEQCLCICQETGEPICGERCCNSESVCENGVDCVCPGGQPYCEGHCLGCPAEAVCEAEQCVCPPLSYYCGTNNSCVPCQVGRTYDPNICSCITNCPGAIGAVCNGVCVDLAVDPANCGTCGTACTSNEVCRDSVCSCELGTGYCGSGAALCVDIHSDPVNCGGCGITCGADQYCQDGFCYCNAGLTFCSNTCRDLLSDRRNCGECAFQCGAFDSCILGICT